MQIELRILKNISYLYLQIVKLQFISILSIINSIFA